MSQFTKIYLPINDLITPNQFPFASNPLHVKNYDYEWIFIVGCLAAFMNAYSIGANDLTGSFAPSVGAKTLRLWQACAIASVCEFLGAYLLGSRNTDTIKSKIISPKQFAGNDDLLMFGMLCADMGAGIWVIIATSYKANVSTTHSIIGAIIGMAMVAMGTSAVDWNSVGMIVASWFISPVLSGVFSSIIYVTIRKVILRHQNSFERSLTFFPVVLFLTIAFQLSLVLVKAAISNKIVTTINGDQAIGIAFGVAFVFSVMFHFLVTNKIRTRYQGYPDEDPADVERKARNLRKAESGSDDNGDTQLAIENKEATKEQSKEENGSFRQMNTARQDRIDKFLGHGEMLHEVIHHDEKVNAIHENAEVFSYRTECVFALLQVFTAMCASFAHGANDVANAVGPLATILTIYQKGDASTLSKVSVPDWILLLGGAGIVVGLSTYGYVLLKTFGVMTIKLTPCRGFAIELGSSIVILCGSYLGIPLSTSHCTTGSLVAVGMCEMKKGSVNWRIVGYNVFSWLVTIVFAAAFSAVLFSFAVYAPSMYYPMNKSNCVTYYGTLYNGTKTGYTGAVQVPQEKGLVKILAGYPSNGAYVNIEAFNP